MQSAFVDIGLERDAFLYVSDFMELPEEDDVEEIPADRVTPAQAYQPQAEPQLATENGPAAGEAQPAEAAEQQPSDNRGRFSGGEPREGRGDWRSRRRGRGRRGERMPESRFARPAAEPVRSEPIENNERAPRNERPERNDRNDRNDRPARHERTDRSDYGPPPGYQPILLPGESISKYSRLNQAQPP